MKTGSISGPRRILLTYMPNSLRMFDRIQALRESAHHLHFSDITIKRRRYAYNQRIATLALRQSIMVAPNVCLYIQPLSKNRHNSNLHILNTQTKSVLILTLVSHKIYKRKWFRDTHNSSSSFYSHRYLSLSCYSHHSLVYASRSSYVYFRPRQNCPRLPRRLEQRHCCLLDFVLLRCRFLRHPWLIVFVRVCGE